MIVTVVTAILTMVFIPESPVRTSGRISVLPATLLAAWLVLFLLPLSEASSWGWGSFRVIGLVVLAIVVAGLWVLAETRSAAPLIDMTMMRKKAVWTNNLSGFLIGFGMYAFMAFLPEFVQTPRAAGYGFGATITRSGLMLLPFTATMFVCSMMTGGLTRRFGGKVLVVAGSLISAVGVALIAFAHSSQGDMYVGTAIIGVGIGLAFSAMSGLIVGAVPPEQVGVASGMNANIRTIGGSVGSAIMASVVTSQLTSAGFPKESGYTHGFIMLAVAFVIAGLAGALIPAIRVRASVDDHDAPHAELGLVAGGTLVGDESE
jgi:MFS family permease